ncbi:MAG: HAD family phosphatase [Patescibacteria group bacterium]
MKKAVIFDLNGVFVVGPMLSERFADEKGVAIEKFLPVLKEILPKIQMPGAESAYSYWKPYLDSWGISMNEEEFLNFWFTAEKENAPMLELAKELKQKGLKLFIMSNNLKERTAYYDANFEFFKGLFNKIYYSWQTGFFKPDSRAYQLILQENNLQPEECIYFDDSEKNVAAANALGIESYVFAGPDHVKEKLSQNFGGCGASAIVRAEPS